jgi:hypothetical protein
MCSGRFQCGSAAVSELQLLKKCPDGSYLLAKSLLFSRKFTFSMKTLTLRVSVLLFTEYQVQIHSAIDNHFSSQEMLTVDHGG